MEVQTARHLIVSQHIYFHGKYAVNVFFFFLTANLLNVFIGKYQLMFIYFNKQGCIKENRDS